MIESKILQKMIGSQKMTIYPQRKKKNFQTMMLAVLLVEILRA